MIHTDAKSLVERGDGLFSQKQGLDRRNQELAEQFYPERADFTVTRDIGEDFADHLMTGYPAMTRRDLGNSLGSMLRPRGQTWFHTKMKRDDQGDGLADRQWLEWATGLQRRAMYDPITMFSRATKEGDHDFATFGGCVISCEENRRDTALLYRCWHLRDLAWYEDSYGQIGGIFRNWQPTAKELVTHFPGKCHERVVTAAEKEPGKKIKVRHAVIRADEYDGQKFKQPWVSLFVDVENQTILEERGSWTRIYVIPRWATLAGSQYPYSPAALIALPDARLLQAMTLTLLEAGEKAVSPPQIGVTEAIRGDMNLYAGGFTAVDAEYDERLGEVLRPISQDRNGLPFGMDIADRQAGMLREAFYLNTLSMPPAGSGDMTAFEVGQRVQEYIRNALPLFEPMEADYNGALCEITFETLLRANAFGAPDTIPPSIQGGEIDFRFESPLAEMIERQKGQTFLEAKAMIAEAAAIDESSVSIMDFSTTLRDVLEGIGAPAKWLREEKDVEADARARQEQEAAQSALAAMDQSAGVAEKLANASQGFAPQAA